MEVKDDSSQDVIQKLTDLFKFAFVKNCKLDGEDANSEDHKTLAELSPLEVMDNFTDLVQDLLSYKENTTHADGDEILQRALKLEKQLQKTEAEVRKHIRVEQQMRLHMETAQTQIEALENTNRKLETQLGLLKGRSKDHDMGKRTYKAKVLEMETKLNSDISNLHRKLETSHAEGDAKKQRKLIEVKGNSMLHKQIESLKRKLDLKEKECHKYLSILKSKNDRDPLESSRRIQSINHTSSRRNSLGESSKFEGTRHKEDAKVRKSESQGRIPDKIHAVIHRQLQIRGLASSRSLSETSRKGTQVLLS
mmetsp:Transcript_27279/g.49019  ORF Transcript_27279/g.49019 Transcript_27279/m.49019 type:complete len:308 (-) Transcript_27279:21-944(-)